MIPSLPRTRVLVSNPLEGIVIMIINGYDIKHGTNMRSADLSGANMRSADLSGADLYNLTGVMDCGTPYSWRVVPRRLPVVHSTRGPGAPIVPG